MVEQITLKEKIESTNDDLVSELTQQTTGNEQVKQIEELIKDLDSSDDPLYQVNCLQLVADIAADQEALKIIESKGVPGKIISLLNQNDPLIIPHALKLFYRVSPKIIEEKYPQILQKLCEFCQSGDKQLLDYAIDLIAAIARGGLFARQVLDRYSGFNEKCLPALGSAIISSDTLLKSRTLACMKDLLEHYEGDSEEEHRKISCKFYHNMINGEMRMTNQLLALCRIPIMEIRIAALEVVAAVAGLNWAQEELVKHPNFTKWITDRSSEACKEGKESKFKILEALVKSKTALNIFSGPIYLEMRKDWKFGPFHVGIAEEMMMDNQQANT